MSDSLVGFDPATIRVSGRPTFQCADCGTRALGDPQTLELRGLGEEEFRTGLRNQVGLQSIPVGWASYGKWVLRCPRCTV